jgi:hypothetical protein
MVAVFQQHGFDRTAHAAHDLAHVLQAGDIVVHRVHDQARRLDAAQLPAHNE